MSEVLDLTAYRSKQVEERAFGAWRKRFGESYGAETKVADFSDSTLYFLAKPGEETAVAYYELWLTGFPGQKHTLLEIVQTFDTTKAEVRKEPIALSPSHPDYDVFDKLAIEDKQVFVRRKLLKALEEFRAKIAEDTEDQ
ncbi:MAG: hypothetical protein JRJ47_01105 [Deltaproteobacteria bacterium]|nr:hypothetical protein [Deltaproteobacteria bacterium]